MGHDVVQDGLACGDPSTSGCSDYGTAAWHIYGNRIGLHDLGGAIPDVMGLRAIQPKAAVVKVMSVPDSRCVRVIVPDDHLANIFHEILIHDMEDEEPPFVAFSELGCLRLDWPKALFTFMARYQFELDQMRKECRERFGATQS